MLIHGRPEHDGLFPINIQSKIYEKIITPRKYKKTTDLRLFTLIIQRQLFSIDGEGWGG